MMKKIQPEQRRSSLRLMMQEKPFLRVIETVNGLEGIIAEQARVRDENGCIKVFDALWFSGLCHAAFLGKPDNEFVSMTEKLAAVQDIFAVTSKPMILDMDTGGATAHFCRRITDLEQIGVSAVVIEDKTGMKRNSMYGSGRFQQMEDADVFAEKIRQGKQAQCTEDFMIFARIESLIAGESTDTAVMRAGKYIRAGADAIVIQSVSPDGADVFRFAANFKLQFPHIPLVLIPTAYAGFTDIELHEKGADVIIYANQLMRSCCLAMEKTAASILREGRSEYADAHYCTSVKTILNWIDGESD